MNPPEAFDVLICSNRLDDALRSAVASCVVDQSLQPDRIVLVVNGVAIGETEQAYLDGLSASWPRLHVLTTPVRGLVFSLNLGLQACGAPLVARMDADDIALPGRFERQVAWMRAHPETTILGTGYQRIDPQGRLLNVVTLPATDAAIRRRLRWSNPLCHPTVMYRREAILALGGYHGALHAEDYDLWVRASRLEGLRFANLPDICLSYQAMPAGEARRSRQAYASVLSTQVREMVNGGGFMWALAAMWTFIKLLLRSS